MKSNKRYTNANFTKRVDREPGRHHTQRAPTEPAKCSVCGAIYSERRWTLAGAPRKVGKHKHWHPAALTVCPGCEKKRRGIPSGFLYVLGDFLPSHRQEIEHLLDKEGGRAAVDNPIARIMNRDTDESGRLVITTTTEHLAQRLGQTLEKAFGGKVRYDFSHENKLARVYWQRD